MTRIWPGDSLVGGQEAYEVQVWLNGSLHDSLTGDWVLIRSVRDRDTNHTGPWCRTLGKSGTYPYICILHFFCIRYTYCTCICSSFSPGWRRFHSLLSFSCLPSKSAVLPPHRVSSSSDLLSPLPCIPTLGSRMSLLVVVSYFLLLSLTSRVTPSQNLPMQFFCLYGHTVRDSYLPFDP